LKGIVKNYYLRKGKLTDKLLKRLDAIVIERPRCIERKKEALLTSSPSSFKLPSIMPSVKVSPRTFDGLTMTDYQTSMASPASP